MSVLAVVKLLMAVAKTTVVKLLTAGGKLRPKPRVRAGYVSILSLWKRLSETCISAITTMPGGDVSSAHEQPVHQKTPTCPPQQGQ